MQENKRIKLFLLERISFLETLVKYKPEYSGILAGIKNALEEINSDGLSNDSAIFLAKYAMECLAVIKESQKIGSAEISELETNGKLQDIQARLTNDELWLNMVLTEISCLKYQ